MLATYHNNVHVSSCFTNKYNKFSYECMDWLIPYTILSYLTFDYYRTHILDSVSHAVRSYVVLFSVVYPSSCIVPCYDSVIAR